MIWGKVLTPGNAKIASATIICFILHALASHLHHRMCRRTLVQYLFFGRSIFCQYMADILYAIESLGDITVHNVVEKAIEMLQPA